MGHAQRYLHPQMPKAWDVNHKKLGKGTNRAGLTHQQFPTGTVMKAQPAAGFLVTLEAMDAGKTCPGAESGPAGRGRKHHQCFQARRLLSKATLKVSPA